MKLKLFSIPLILALAAMGCSSVRVVSDYDTSIDFNQYQTYRWIQAKNSSPKNSLTSKRTHDAIEDVLAEKGFEKTTGRPDMLVINHLNSKNKVDVNVYGYHYGRYGRWGGRHVDVHKYKEGVLIIDIVDAKTKELIWRGIGTKPINPRLSALERDEEIYEMVSKVLEEFPPNS